MLERFLIVWLAALSGLAYAWPKAIWDPFTASRPWLPAVFAVTMFLIGGLLPRDEIAQVVRRWPTVFGGTAVQYAVMPAVGLLVGRAFGLEGRLLMGVVLVGCVPGAMASNVLTLLSRGNVSYSVSLTTTATLVSPLVVPAVLYLALSRLPSLEVVARQSSARAIAQQAFSIVLWQVVVPVLAGHLLSRYWDGWRRTVVRIGPLLANLAILWIIATVLALNRAILPRTGVWLATALLAINGLGYAAGWLAGWGMRLPEGMRRALVLEVGMQNAGLGSVLATQLFHSAKESPEALPPALYAFGCMLTGTILAQWWAWRSTAEMTTAEANPLGAD